MRDLSSSRFLVVFCVLLAPLAGKAREASTCFGTPAAGSLANGWQLPRRGENFAPYSAIGWVAGRTYVHSEVHALVIDAYEALAKGAPTKVFLYGETGLAEGGRFRPHKTHQNGLSVDFMVPVVDGSGASVPLPTSLANRLGYDLEFDSRGELDDLRIDFEAIAFHLAALTQVREGKAIAIRRVIFDPELQPFLHNTKAWPEIKGLRFSKRRSWVRHDEHYHVDFSVACESPSAGSAAR